MQTTIFMIMMIVICGMDTMKAQDQSILTPILISCNGTIFTYDSVGGVERNLLLSNAIFRIMDDANLICETEERANFPLNNLDVSTSIPQRTIYYEAACRKSESMTRPADCSKTLSYIGRQLFESWCVGRDIAYGYTNVCYMRYSFNRPLKAFMSAPWSVPVN